MDDKVQAIEQNIEKNNRRLEIATQTLNWLSVSGSEVFYSASLPAEHWYGENIIANMIEKANLPNLKTVKFHGVESNRKIALKSIKNIPEQAHLINNSLHYLMTRQVVERKCGVGYINEDERVDEILYNFLWADYCGLPTRKLLKNAGGYLANMKDGMFYITFALRSRQEGGFDAFCKKAGLSKSDPVGSIIKRLKKFCPSAKLCYKVLYRGGKHNTTDMVTLGFVKGLQSPNSVGVIEKDTRDNHNRKKNYQTYMRYKKDMTLFKGEKPKGIQATVTGKTTPEQKSEIIKLIDRGLDSRVIADKVGVGVRQVSSIKAHHNNPDSFKALKKKRS